MITTGRQINVLLGHGDSTRFNLLGGTNGTAGDVVVFGQGRGRFFRDAKDKRVQFASTRSTTLTRRGPMKDPMA